MLAAEERTEIEAEFPHYPNRKAVCIDAMKIVQKHRGWVSDEALHDIGPHLHPVEVVIEREPHPEVK